MGTQDLAPFGIHSVPISDLGGGRRPATAGDLLALSLGHPLDPAVDKRTLPKAIRPGDPDASSIDAEPAAIDAEPEVLAPPKAPGTPDAKAGSGPIPPRKETPAELLQAAALGWH